MRGSSPGPDGPEEGTRRRRRGGLLRPFVAIGDGHDRVLGNQKGVTKLIFRRTSLRAGSNLADFNGLQQLPPARVAGQQDQATATTFVCNRCAAPAQKSGVAIRLAGSGVHGFRLKLYQAGQGIQGFFCRRYKISIVATELAQIQFRRADDGNCRGFDRIVKSYPQ